MGNFMILIITGHLAYPLVSQMAEKSKKETVVHIAETQVAAFLTPTQIIKEIASTVKTSIQGYNIMSTLLRNFVN